MEIISRCWQIDADGYFVADLFDHDPLLNGVMFTTVECPSGVFRKPQFKNGKWKEGFIFSPDLLLKEASAKSQYKLLMAYQNKKSCGVKYQFGSSVDTIQTRNDYDIANISVLLHRALAMRATGDQTEIAFRAQSNTVYRISPDFAISMCQFVLGEISRLREIYWTLKDEISSSSTVEQVNLIAWTEV